VVGHIAFVLLLQVGIALLIRSWAAGTAAAVGWTFSREIAQAEYRWIEQFGEGLRANMPWWGGLDFRVWQHLDPWLDWALPCGVTLAVAALAARRGSRGETGTGRGSNLLSRIMRLLRRLPSSKSRLHLS
jgi:hypothetical protein